MDERLRTILVALTRANGAILVDREEGYCGSCGTGPYTIEHTPVCIATLAAALLNEQHPDWLVTDRTPASAVPSDTSRFKKGIIISATPEAEQKQLLGEAVQKAGIPWT